MTQTTNILNDNATATTVSPVHGTIVQGDEIHRFHLVGAQDNSLVLADDLYNNHFIAEPLKRAMAESIERQQQFNKEAQILSQIIEEWKVEHQDKIDLGDTKIATSVFMSPSGKVRFQFIVVPQEGHEDFLETELVKLDSRILNDPAFQIIRLDSLPI